MPLDNKRLDGLTVEELRKIPLDAEARGDMLLETKIEIYDRKCAGCGFIRLEVISGRKGEVKAVYNNIASAILEAQRIGADINRTCDYPGDYEHTTYGIERPTLSEIVTNTCSFWRPAGIEANDETLTIGDYNEVQPIPDRQVPEHRGGGEIPGFETVPQPHITGSVSIKSIASRIFRQET